MKKIKIFICICLPMLSFAQIKKPIPGIGGNTVTRLSKVEIYSEPNFQGTATQVLTNKTNIDLKIAAPYRISVKVAKDFVAYINTCNEFNDEILLYGTNNNVQLTGNCPINVRIEKAVTIDLRFAGISTSLHNNDCKKVFGNVKVNAFELSADGYRINSILKEVNLSNALGQTDWMMFTNFSSSTKALIFENYVFNNNPIPVLRNTLTSTEPAYPVGSPKMAVFIVGESAVRENRVRIEVNTNIGTAHKMNDVAKYFPALRMKENVILNKQLSECGIIAGTTPAEHEIIFGPYNLKAAQCETCTQTEEAHAVRVHMVGYW